MIELKTYRSAKKLEAAVVGYFRAISRSEVVREDGKPVLNGQGDAVLRLRYIVPPTVPGLCKHIGVLPRTFESFKTSPDPLIRRTAEWALLMIEDWFVTELIERSKGIDGIKLLYTDRTPGGEAETEEVSGPDLAAKRQLLKEIFSEAEKNG